MSEAWVEGLKVADLKDELKKRNLPVSGLKAALAERLLQALANEQAENKDEPAPAAAPDPSPEPAEESEPEPRPDDAGSRGGKSDPGPAPEAAPAPAPAPAEKIVAPPPAKPDAPEPPEQSSNILEDILGPDADEDGDRMDDQDQDEMEEPAVQEKAESPAAAKPASTPKTELALKESESPAAAPDSAMADQDKEAGSSGRKRQPIPLFQPRQRVQEDKSSAAAPSPAGTAPSKDAASKDAALSRAEGQLKRDRSPPSTDPKSKPVVEIPEPAAKLARTASRDTPRGAGGQTPGARGANTPKVPKGEPTRALRINNLVRPFTENMLRELLANKKGKEGERKIVDMWLPVIKTHVVVIFEGVEEANAVYDETAGLNWPAASPKLLSPIFLSVEAAENEIAVGRDPKLAAARSGSPAGGPVPAKQVPGESPRGAASMAANAIARAAASAAAAKLPTRKAEGGVAGADGEEVKAGAAAARDGGAAAPESVKTVVDEPMEEAIELDALFRKTTTKPCIYYLPLTDEEVVRRKAREALKPDAGAAGQKVVTGEAHTGPGVADRSEPIDARAVGGLRPGGRDGPQGDRRDSERGMGRGRDAWRGRNDRNFHRR